MKKKKHETLEKLFKYTKSEILDSLGRQYCGEEVAERMLRDLEHRERLNALDEEKEASDNAIAASEAYSIWLSDMCKKYGNGEHVSLKDIPQKEIQRGQKLAENMAAAHDKSEKAFRRVNKLLDI